MSSDNSTNFSSAANNDDPEHRNNSAGSAHELRKPCNNLNDPNETFSPLAHDRNDTQIQIRPIDSATFLWASYEKFPHVLGITANSNDIDKLHYLFQKNDSSTDDLRKYHQSSTPLVRFFRGAAMRTHEELFNEFAAVLQFPYFFGYNWDALWDMLTDLGWLEPFSNLILVIYDADQLLADDLPAVTQFNDILTELNSYWNPGPSIQQSDDNHEKNIDADPDQHAIRILYHHQASHNIPDDLLVDKGFTAIYEIIWD